MLDCCFSEMIFCFDRTLMKIISRMELTKVLALHAIRFSLLAIEAICGNEIDIFSDCLPQLPIDAVPCHLKRLVRYLCLWLLILNVDTLPKVLCDMVLCAKNMIYPLPNCTGFMLFRSCFSNVLTETHKSFMHFLYEFRLCFMNSSLISLLIHRFGHECMG